MTLQEIKQVVLELSHAEKKELGAYIGEIVVEGKEQHPPQALSEKDKIRQMLGDALVEFSEPPEELSIDEQTLLAILDTPYVK